MPLKIYPRKDRGGLYYYRGTLAGHRLRGACDTKNRETAQRIAAEIEARFWKRGVVDKNELTFPKAVTLYLAAGKPDRFIDRLVDYWKDAKVRDMTPGAIRQAAIDLMPKGKNSSRNRQVIVPTQAIINHCAELQLCTHLKMKRFKVETKLKKPATKEWINDFCAHAARADIGALALFLFATGARISEALSIGWNDIDFKRHVATIKQTKLGNERSAHLPPNLLVALANLPREEKPFPLTISAAEWHWKATCEAAGIEPLTFHSCRHGFATSLNNKGVGVKTIAKLGGWKSAQHLFNTYLHADQDPTLTNLLFDEIGTGIDTAKTKRKRKQ